MAETIDKIRLEIQMLREAIAANEVCVRASVAFIKEEQIQISSLNQKIALGPEADIERKKQFILNAQKRCEECRQTRLKPALSYLIQQKKDLLNWEAQLLLEQKKLASSEIGNRYGSLFKKIDEMFRHTQECTSTTPYSQPRH